jgi:hypothetical protein
MNKDSSYLVQKCSKNVLLNNDTGNGSNSGIALRVTLSYPLYRGSNEAFIDNQSMIKIGAYPGDTIEILGSCRAVAKCSQLSAEDEGRGIIRLDRFLTMNVCATESQVVRIRKITQVPVKEVILYTPAPLPEQPTWSFNMSTIGQPIGFGDIVFLQRQDKTIILRVVNTLPSSEVANSDSTLVVSAGTKFRITSNKYDFKMNLPITAATRRHIVREGSIV